MASCHDKEVETVATIEQKTQEFEEGFKEAFTRNINPNQTWGFNVGSEVAASRAFSRGSDEKATTRGNSEPGGCIDYLVQNLTAKTTTTYTEYFKKRSLRQYGRVFCEDLGGQYKSNRKDFDYNDVVFDAYLWKEELWKKVTIVNTYEVKAYKESTRTEVELVYDANGQPVYKKKEDGSYMTDGNGNKIQETKSSEVTDIIRYEEKDSKRSYQYDTPEYSKVSDDSTKYYADICLIACGATKPIKVGGNNVQEAHDAFGGYSVDCIINTFDEHSTREGGFGYHETVPPITYKQVDITTEVDKSNPSINDIPIYVQWSGTAAKNIQAKRGEVPQKYMTTGKDKWTSERCFLGNAYPEFTNWVESADSLLNTSVQGEESLYNSYPGADAGLDFTVSTGDETTTCLNILSDRTEVATVANDELVIHELYDENGNFKETLSGEPENIQPGGQGGGGQQGDSSNSVVLVTPSNPVSSGNIVTDRETVQSYYEKMASGRSKITVTISPTEDNWNYLTFSYGGDQGEIFSVHGPYGQAGTDYSNYVKGQTFTITWYIDVDTLYSKLLSNQNWFPGGLFHVKGAQATIVGLTLYF